MVGRWAGGINLGGDIKRGVIFVSNHDNLNNIIIMIMIIIIITITTCLMLLPIAYCLLPICSSLLGRVLGHVLARQGCQCHSPL